MMKGQYTLASSRRRASAEASVTARPDPRRASVAAFRRKTLACMAVVTPMRALYPVDMPM